MDRGRVHLFWGVVLSLVVLVALWALSRYLEQREVLWLEGVVECRNYRASSKLAGRINRLYVDEGDRVAKGDTLFVLSTPELDAKLEQAKGASQSAEALDRELLRGARAEQRAEARSVVERAAAALQLAQKSYDRVSVLYSEGVATAQQYDEAKAQRDAAQAQYGAARAQYELVAQGATTEQRQAAQGRVSQALGAVAEVEGYLRDAVVVAPVSGEVSTLTAYESELVASGYPVVVVADLDNVWASFNIREDYMPQFKMGSSFVAYLPAIDREVEFEVSYIAAEATFATWQAARTLGDFDIRSFEIRMRPKVEVTALRPGMSVLIRAQR